MENCIFCKIITGEIPSTTVYEDECVKAFLDISQTTPGHTLVIPKKHVADLFEYDTSLAADVFTRIPKIARAIKASDDSIVGMNVVNNNGAVAYQSVFHSHFHLIPRYSKRDDFKMVFADNSNKYSQEQLTEIAAQIKEQLKE
ncbi:HIT family protein [Liquorilactobacillus capillatus]|uniref:Histidine triad (HIT) protein n=1 Tax=Liquorilactobacillus capillatus DSM 19910 TaxID=1423731 RepID=A0A0R1M515_9LACO|nr:HIT family protein [Liquorilactobacillus capillatus]KRL03184.1 histidine triad (HIT) protein [Liquorilactobacillus capillatus DSM 19910]